MKKFLIDTNIILDMLAKREPYYSDAVALFSLADKNQVNLSVSALSLINTHYILKKYRSEQDTRRIISTFKVLVRVLPLDEKITDLALNSDFKDFEDAVQYFTAIENDHVGIITRNQSDFKTSSIPVMSAGEYLRSR